MPRGVNTSHGSISVGTSEHDNPPQVQARFEGIVMDPQLVCLSPGEARAVAKLLEESADEVEARRVRIRERVGR